MAHSPLRRAFVVVVVVGSVAASGACGSSDGGGDVDGGGPCGGAAICNPPAETGAFDTDVRDVGPLPPKDTGPGCGVGAPCGDTGRSDGSADAFADAPPGSGPTLGGCAILPADDEWNREVSADAVDPNSANYIAAMAPTKSVHPDWGSRTDHYGIPYVVVPASQPKVPVVFDYAAESDPGPYPIPTDAPIEGNPGDTTGDRHVLALQQGTCLLYEMFASVKDATGDGWHAGSGALFDLSSNKLRPEGWTSADAAGLPILPGLARPDEVLGRKEIRHALRFTVVNSQHAYVHPATHYASSKTDPNLPPMGLRLRLKASVDVSTYGAPTQVVLVALKKYGMFVADNGADWFISGSSDDAWTPAVMDVLVGELAKVHGTDFEVVKAGPLVTK